MWKDGQCPNDGLHVLRRRLYCSQDATSITETILCTKQHVPIIHSRDAALL